MSYTFGAGTGDDVSTLTNSSFGANGNAGLFMGWWYPTTLTATRGYWSAGNTIGAEVDTTTSELRMRSDNTTDGQWTTSGAGITINKWWFLAFASAYNNTGPVVAQRVWVGDDVTPPVEVTVTQATAPVGNNAGNSNLYAGNKGTGTLAFQGDIGGLAWVNSDANATSASLLGILTNGAISQAEADLIRDRWIIPTWLGNFPWQNAHGGPNTTGINSFGVMDFSAPGANSPVSHQNSVGNAGSSINLMSVSGATFSSNQPPRLLRANPCILPPLPRRI